MGWVLTVPTFLAVLTVPLSVSQGDAENLFFALGAAAYLFLLVRVIIPACAVWAWWRRS